MFLWEKTMAERVGFEPTVVLPTHAFQACALNHSAISPARRTVRIRFNPKPSTASHSSRKGTKGKFNPSGLFEKMELTRVC